MKKVLILLAGLFIILLAVLIGQSYLKKTPTATIDDHKFKLMIAKTGKEKEIGLSETKNLPQDQGMLFPFDSPGYYSFWMKNMKFPIDIIFIKDNAIITIYKDVSPPKTSNESLPVYSPQSPADSVLEINASKSSQYDFKQGDTVKYENLGADK